MWPNPQDTTDLVTFTEGILKAKPHFLCSVKIDGGAINIFENERILLQWALVVRYIANMIRGSGKNNTNLHHKYKEFFWKGFSCKTFSANSVISQVW